MAHKGENDMNEITFKKAMKVLDDLHKAIDKAAASVEASKKSKQVA